MKNTTLLGLVTALCILSGIGIAGDYNLRDSLDDAADFADDQLREFDLNPGVSTDDGIVITNEGDAFLNLTAVGQQVVNSTKGLANETSNLTGIGPINATDIWNNTTEKASDAAYEFMEAKVKEKAQAEAREKVNNSGLPIPDEYADGAANLLVDFFL